MSRDAWGVSLVTRGISNQVLLPPSVSVCGTWRRGPAGPRGVPLLRMGSGQGGGGWLPTGGNGSQTCHLSQRPADETHSLPAAPAASGRGPHSSPQAQEQQEDGGRVSAADACGGNMKTMTSGLPTTHSGCTCTQFWGDGDQEPNGWGKATSWYLFRLVRGSCEFGV